MSPNNVFFSFVGGSEDSVVFFEHEISADRGCFYFIVIIAVKYSAEFNHSSLSHLHSAVLARSAAVDFPIIITNGLRRVIPQTCWSELAS